MKKILTLLIVSTLFTTLQAQYFKAKLQEDHTIQIERMRGQLSSSSARDNFDQLPGFPKGTLANPTFKNLRNVTLADLTGDGVEEILMATWNKLFVYSADTLLWEKTLSGVAIYPPSVADVDHNGTLDIVQTTGGVPAAGRLYLLDHNGNDFPNWPLNFNDNWILSAAALSDLNNDNQMEIIVSERISPAGSVHILQLDGGPFNANWPVTLDRTPAITPSVGDIDNDGEKDIVVYSTESRYIFNLDGTPKTGFPLTTHPNQRYSFQSPLLVDFDEDLQYEIVGATHGDAPQFYVLNSDGSFRDGWPIDVPDAAWTFNTPTVVEIDGEYQILMSRPGNENPLPVLFNWDTAGNLQSDFPITKAGGLEGLISVADIDNDDQFELIFGANVIDTAGYGFIHAYELDGTTEVAGFPIRPRGWTFMNGANLGDVNNDGSLDLIALTYTSTFGTGTDSAYLHVYDLEVPYDPEKILWRTYKGSNTRTGLIGEQLVSDVSPSLNQEIKVALFPNPATESINVNIELDHAERIGIHVFNHLGQAIHTTSSQELQAGPHQWQIPLNNFPTGLYWISIKGHEQQTVKKFIKN